MAPSMLGDRTKRTRALPGGAMIDHHDRWRQPGTVWSYPNLHGDEVVTADNSGTRAAGNASYDPFGQPIDPSTGNIGTTSADDAVPDTSSRVRGGAQLHVRFLGLMDTMCRHGDW